MSRPFIQYTWGVKLWELIDKIGEVTTIAQDKVKNIFAVSYGFGDLEKPNFKNYKLWVGPQTQKQDPSLYYNGVFFFRIAFPFFIGVMFRWSANTTTKSFIQTHIGWKLNGRFAIALRIQSDTSAEAGMDFPNPGQAWGFMEGGK